MRKVCTYALLIFVVCLANVVCGEGFVADTLVSTSHGSIPIKELIIGDQVQACTFDDSVTLTPIVNLVASEIDSFIRLEVDDDVIELTHDQLLFVPLQQTWLLASDIRPGMYLLGAPLRALQVQSVTTIDQRMQVYAISLNEHHNYLVGKHGVVAHNFTECAVLAVEAAEGATFLSAFLAANPLVAPITISVGGAGLAGYLIGTFVGEIKESRKAKRDKDKNSVNTSQSESPKKPDDDHEKRKKEEEEFRKRHPNGRYEDARYHKSYPSGQKNPRPIDGQEALDNSYSISETTPRRIGVSNKEFVVLDRTQEGLYHGHVRRWAELTIDMQKALKKAGVVTSRGKFII